MIPFANIWKMCKQVILRDIMTPMLNEESFANFINIEVQGHCLTFIQGHLKPNFEISFTQKKLPGQLKLYLMLGLIRLKGMKM